MSDRAESVVRDYYEALRNGDPLEPYFLERESTVKFGISEALFGSDAVSKALQEQTEATAEWTVESDTLVVSEHGGVATFADKVTMAWTDVDSGERRRFETRWSGTLLRQDDPQDEVPAWLFAGMHVSTSDAL